MGIFSAFSSHIVAIVGMDLNGTMYAATKSGTHVMKFVNSEVWYDISTVEWNKRLVNNPNLIEAVEIPDILPSKSTLSGMNWAMKNNKRILGKPRFPEAVLKKCTRKNSCLEHSQSFQETLTFFNKNIGLKYESFLKVEPIVDVSITIFQKSRTKVTYRSGVPPRGVLKICSKFTREHPCRSVISIKLQCKFIAITLWHGCLL